MNTHGVAVGVAAGVADLVAIGLGSTVGIGSGVLCAELGADIEISGTCELSRKSLEPT